jgi:hypothetical protein
MRLSRPHRRAIASVFKTKDGRMTKSQETKKDEKKKSQKTLKEKRLEKKAKKESKK